MHEGGVSNTLARGKAPRVEGRGQTNAFSARRRGVCLATWLALLALDKDIVDTSNLVGKSIDDAVVHDSGGFIRTMVDYRRNIVPFIAGFVIAWLLGREFSSTLPSQPLSEEQHRSKFTTQLSNIIYDEAAFTQLSSKIYYEATSPDSLDNTSRRKKYHLNAMPKGNGGLADSDRILLGDIYYNSTSVFGKRNVGTLVSQWYSSIMTLNKRCSSEFGLGESTQIAAYVGVPRYTGEWLLELGLLLPIAPSERAIAFFRH